MSDFFDGLAEQDRVFWLLDDRAKNASDSFDLIDFYHPTGFMRQQIANLGKAVLENERRSGMGTAVLEKERTFGVSDDSEILRKLDRLLSGCFKPPDLREHIDEIKRLLTLAYVIDLKLGKEQLEPPAKTGKKTKESLDEGRPLGTESNKSNAEKRRRQMLEEDLILRKRNRNLDLSARARAIQKKVTKSDGKQYTLKYIRDYIKKNGLPTEPG